MVHSTSEMCFIGIKADPEDILNPDLIPWQNINEEVRGSDSTYNPTIDVLIESEFLVNGGRNEEVEFDESIIQSETLKIRDISVEISKNMEKLTQIREELLTENKINDLKSIIDGLFTVVETLQKTMNSYKIDLQYFKDNDK